MHIRISRLWILFSWNIGLNVQASFVETYRYSYFNFLGSTVTSVILVGDSGFTLLLLNITW